MRILFAVLVFLTLPLSASAQNPVKKPPAQPTGLRLTDVFFEDFHGAPTPRWEMKPGEEVALNFRIDGFGRQEGLNKEGLREQRVHLTYEITLRDPEGNPVAPAQS